ncbi:unnamed protein product [Ilex paraguariensis]|uniref:Pentatricopeptide repeat-containing protein n=1 Tax=Ilex paraguariensis TaxID=185542 RepID=A0ABC8UAV3_9AQUA
MVEKDVVSWSSMVDGYCRNGRLGEARVLFDRMEEKNVVTWTAMNNGYVKMGCFEDRFGCIDAANNVFCMMKERYVVSWNSLIAGYAQAEEIEETYKLFKEVPDKDLVSWTTMIIGFSSRGMIGKSTKLFKMMQEKDDVAWTALISGFVNNGEYEEAIYWFIDMLQQVVRPNPLTLSRLLSASAGLATLNQGLQVHAHVVKMVMELDLSIQNSLISMYSKCGSVNDAYKTFQTIPSPNVVSFNSIITGFAQNGHGKVALNFFKKMHDECQEPNEITFLGVLSACTHMGMVEEGWKYFKSMRYLYKIESGPDHYACMVDLLERAAQHLSKLEPHNAAPYVILSNLYSVSRNMKDEEQVRIANKLKGMKKSPSCNWIMV